MRKFIVAALVLLSLHGVGDAAIGTLGGRSGDTRIQKNLVTDYGAACNAQSATRIATISAGSPNLAVTVNTFVSGDVGKTIAVPGAANGGNTLTTTISAFVDAQHITLGSNAQVALSSASSYLIWGTDDSAAFLAFKAAFQGTTPVQLNLPGHCGYNPVGGSPAQFPFKGIGDLIVAGNGTATSGYKALAPNGLFGGSGQFADSNHSLRTNTANSGDSCVIAKTQPAVTVSAVTPSFAPTASFTASVSGMTMTVTAVASGTIVAGTIIHNADSNPGFFNTVQAYGTGGTTGVGGTGTYALSVTTSFPSQPVITVPTAFTASVDAVGVMTVTAIQDGTLAVGMPLFSSDGSITNTTTIKSQITGSAGSTGTYQLDNSPQNAIVSPIQFQTAGLIRVTLNSTTGLTTGDTLYLSGMLGRGAMPQRMNGLKWIKVINGTQVDLFQVVFDGSYTSGGTGGGDRTSLFSVGSKAMMTGWNNQSYWNTPYSYPSNPHWFEYKTVVSTNSTTHQICFDSPLANTYKSTWPQYNTGNQFEVDPGGPATVYVLDPSWETTIVYKDFTLDNPSSQSTANGRNITWQNIVMTGAACAIPTQNETHNWIDVVGVNCTIETDKIVGTWNISGASVLTKVDVQSSSMDTINVSGLTVNQWFGGPKVLNVTNSTFVCSGCTTGSAGFSPGTLAYGVSDSTSITNSSVGFAFGGFGDGTRVDDPKKPWSMVGGVITIPNAYSFSGCCNYSEIQTRFMVPGHYVMWAGAGGGGASGQRGRAFKIVDVTQDVDNTYVTTSEAGGFPTGAWTTNGLSVNSHPSPVFTASGLSGSASALAFNGCPVATPQWSCQNVTFTGGASGASGIFYYRPYLWGVLDTFTVTNNVPYTGGGALSWKMSEFDNWPILKTDLTQVSFGASPNGQFTINTKLPSSCGSCTRTLTPSGATNTQVGDALTATPSGALFGGNSLGGPIFSANTPSDSPQVTVTLRTNQQLP